MFYRGASQLPRNQGKTLLELLIVLVIISILVSLVFPVTSYFKRRAQDATCMANLRGLHAGFSAYLGDHAFVWPQSPENRKDAPDDIDEDELCKWWIDQIKPYGVARKNWICQSDPDRATANLNDEKHYEMSYIPTPFDETPNRAYDWKSQPWLIEQGGFHQEGAANKVMPDGSIQKDAFPMPTE